MSESTAIKSIIWLDDNIKSYKTAVNKIASSNYILTVSDNYADAHKKMQDFKFDIALIDMKLGANLENTGLDLIYSISKVKKCDNFIIVTNYPEYSGLEDNEFLSLNIPIVPKSKFVKDPVSELSEYGGVSEVKLKSSSDFQRGVVPNSGSSFYRIIPSWALIGRTLSVKMQTALSAIPALAFMLNQAATNNYLKIADIPRYIFIEYLLGYLFILVSITLYFISSPKIIGEHKSSNAYAINMQQNYYSDENYRKQIESVIGYKPDEPSYWSMKRYFNIDNYQQPQRRALVVISAALGFILLAMPTFRNIISLLQFVLSEG